MARGVPWQPRCLYIEIIKDGGGEINSQKKSSEKAVCITCNDVKILHTCTQSGTNTHIHTDILNRTRDQTRVRTHKESWDVREKTCMILYIT